MIHIDKDRYVAAMDVEYRRYDLDILPPSVRDPAWVMVIRPLDRKTPIVMPGNASDTGAIAAAEAAVDSTYTKALRALSRSRAYE